jgi:hypothetical protein
MDFHLFWYLYPRWIVLPGTHPGPRVVMGVRTATRVDSCARRRFTLFSLAGFSWTARKDSFWGFIATPQKRQTRYDKVQFITIVLGSVTILSLGRCFSIEGMIATDLMAFEPEKGWGWNMIPFLSKDDLIDRSISLTQNRAGTSKNSRMESYKHVWRSMESRSGKWWRYGRYGKMIHSNWTWYSSKPDVFHETANLDVHTSHQKQIDIHTLGNGRFAPLQMICVLIMMIF